MSIVAGTPSQLAFTTQPVGNVGEATNFTTSPRVSVEDSNGNVVTTDTGSVTLATNGGPGGTLTCTNVGFPTISAAGGVATFTNCRITGTAAAGTYTLQATRSGLTTGVSSNVVITPGIATKLVFTTQPVGGVPEATNFSTSPVVSVEDANSNVVTGDAGTVKLAINSGPAAGSLSCSNTTINAAAGVATFTNCQITGTAAAGTYTLIATRTGAGALTSTGGSSNVVIGVGSLDHFTFAAVSPQIDGVAFTGTNTLTAQDVSGNTITSFDASANNVTITALSPLVGSVSGLDSPANVLNQAADFSGGVANLAALGMTYTGTTGTGAFKATSATGKSGTSSNVVINPGALDHFSFVAAGSQTDGVAFTGTNTLTAQDIGGNTITSFNASTTNVTITVGSLLTGAVSGLDTPANVLNQAGDFISGVANLTTLGMTYTGNAATGTFTATSSSGKTGTSGNVAISVGSLAKFAYALATPQTDGVAFTGTNTLTAQDAGGNTITSFSAASNPVTIAAVSPLTGTATFSSGATGSVLNAAGDFNSGVANLTSLGIKYVGNATSGTFTATSGGKVGTSGTVAIGVGSLAKFAFVLASPQASGAAFTGTNTLTAQDAGGNTITTFSAASNPVTITAVAPLSGTVSGLDTPANVLNQAGDFNSGVANLTSLGMTYTGNSATGTLYGHVWECHRNVRKRHGRKRARSRPAGQLLEREPSQQLLDLELGELHRRAHARVPPRIRREGLHESFVRVRERDRQSRQHLDSSVGTVFVGHQQRGGRHRDLDDASRNDRHGYRDRQPPDELRHQRGAARGCDGMVGALVESLGRPRRREQHERLDRDRARQRRNSYSKRRPRDRDWLRRRKHEHTGRSQQLHGADRANRQRVCRVRDPGKHEPPCRVLGDQQFRWMVSFDGCLSPRVIPGPPILFPACRDGTCSRSRRPRGRATR